MLKIPKDKLPHHLAIIMDGNGRWAKRRGLPRSEGHRVGMEKVREMGRLCLDFGIKVLTVYAFSCQNWKRPKEEVDFLMSTFERYLDEEADDLNERGIQLRVIGRKDGLSPELRRRIKAAMELTRRNRKLIFNLALNYGGQEEIVDAVRAIAEKVKRGELSPDQINVDLLSQHLYTADLPYPDLLIRTGGEYRLSNFLLYQIAYTELWITPTFWPDFGKEQLIQALEEYARRERRFGGLGPSVETGRS